MVVFLRRERILEEEQAVRLQRLAQVDGFVERDALVDVMQELDVVAKLGPQMFEEFGQHANVRTHSQIAFGFVGPTTSSAAPGAGRAPPPAP